MDHRNDRYKSAEQKVERQAFDIHLQRRPHLSSSITEPSKPSYTTSHQHRTPLRISDITNPLVHPNTPSNLSPQASSSHKHRRHINLPATTRHSTSPSTQLASRKLQARSILSIPFIYATSDPLRQLSVVPALLHAELLAANMHPASLDETLPRAPCICISSPVEMQFRDPQLCNLWFGCSLPPVGYIRR